MAITRFDKPAQSKYTSQFVEEKYPFEAIQQAGQMMQDKITGVRQAAGELESKLSINATPEIPSVYRKAKATEQQYQQKVDEIIGEFQKIEDINKTARKIQQLNAQWQQDPVKNNAERITKLWQEAKEEEQKLARKGDPYFNVMRQLQREGQLGLNTMFQGPAVRKGAPSTAAQDYVRDITKDIEPQKIEDREGVTREKLLRQRVRDVAGVDEKGTEIVDPGKGFQSFMGSYSNEQLRELQQRTGKTPQELYLDAVNQRAEEIRQYDVTRESGSGGDGEGEVVKLDQQNAQYLPENYPFKPGATEYNFGDEQRTFDVSVTDPIEIDPQKGEPKKKQGKKTYENATMEGVIVDADNNKFVRLVDRLPGDVKKKDGEPVYDVYPYGEGTKEELYQQAKQQLSTRDDIENPDKAARDRVNELISGTEPVREQSVITDIIVPIEGNKNKHLSRYFDLPKNKIQSLDKYNTRDRSLIREFYSKNSDNFENINEAINHLKQKQFID